MAVITAVRDSVRDPRVALTPEVVKQLISAGHGVVVEKGAGAGAGFRDVDFVDAGAEIATTASAIRNADVVVSIGRPPAAVLDGLRPGSVIAGLLEPSSAPEELERAAARGVRVLALEQLPRQLSRAQTMDVLTSQASVAGYRAALVAAHAYGRYLPMMVTAAGTAKPASVLVLGAGVAGLQAIATSRRLGARVTAYDVRPAAREEIASLGAAFLDTGIVASGDGGYARELTREEADAQREALSAAIANFDIVIATAKVPGRKPPELVPASALSAMRRGSVVVDLAASAFGGNVAGSVDGETLVTPRGVTVIGAGAIAAEMAPAASDAFARNMLALIQALAPDGALAVDPDDDVVGALLVRARKEAAA
jgi:NAD(P) transhydrogenase subunit alpha